MIIDAGAGFKSRFFGFNQSGIAIPIDLICVRAMRAHTDANIRHGLSLAGFMTLS